MPISNEFDGLRWWLPEEEFMRKQERRRKAAEMPLRLGMRTSLMVEGGYEQVVSADADTARTVIDVASTNDLTGSLWIEGPRALDEAERERLVRVIVPVAPVEIMQQQHCSVANRLKLGVEKSPAMFIPSKLPDFDAAIESDSPIVSGVGFEIEGCWTRNEEEIGMHIAGDGSVRDMRSPSEQNSHPLRVIGEARMGIYKNGVIRRDQVHRVYPEHVNSSCGLHVHLSFPTDSLYNVFVSETFFHWFLEGLKEWRKQQERKGAEKYDTFWNRIRGHSAYCKTSYTPTNAMAQIRRVGDRYTAINYCRGQHGTIEVRVLNAYHTSEECVDAVEEVTRLFRLWGSRVQVPSHYLVHSSAEAAQLLDKFPAWNRDLVVDGNFGSDPMNAIRWADLLPTYFRREYGALSELPRFRYGGDSFQIRRINLVRMRRRPAHAGDRCRACDGYGFVFCTRGRTHDPCGCVEWCRVCHPEYYANQRVQHTTDRCWSEPYNELFYRTGARTTHWSVHNSARLPWQFAARAYAPARRNSGCPFCSGDIRLDPVRHRLNCIGEFDEQVGQHFCFVLR